MSRTKINLILAYDRHYDRDWVPSLGLGYLSSYLKKNNDNIDVRILTDINQIIKNEPDLVGISCATQNINTAVNYAKQIKKHTLATVVLGGPHINALPLNLPICFDYGIIGEGEQTFLELVNFLQNKKKQNPTLIKGIVFFDKNQKLIFTGNRDFFQNLDCLPHPDRSQLNFDNSTVHMLTSRGCPNNCSFCGSRTLWKNPRYFSVDYIIDEIESIISNYHPTIINFFDDIFFKNKKELRQLCQKINNKKLNGKTAFTCYMRADIVDLEIMQILKKIGVQYIFFGAESGSNRVLAYLKNSRASVEKNQYLLDLAKRLDIKVGATFIKGAPIETKQDLLMTYDFIKKNIQSGKLDLWKIFYLAPFPGTAMWYYAKKRGIVDENMDFSYFSKPEKYLYLNENMSQKEFLSICHHQEKEIKR